MFIVPEHQYHDVLFDLFRKGYTLDELADNIVFNDNENITLNLSNADDSVVRVEMDIKRERTLSMGSITVVCLCADEAFVFEFFEGGERIGRIVAVSSDKSKHNIRHIEHETIGFIFQWIFDVCTEKDIAGITVTKMIGEEGDEQTILSFRCSKTSVSTKSFYKYCL